MVTTSTTDGGQVRFGGSGSTPGTSPCPGVGPYNSSDWLLVKYTDLGVSGQLSWALAGGSPGQNRGPNLAIHNGRVNVGGFITAPASFGPTTLTPLPIGLANEAVLAEIGEAAPLATAAARWAGDLQLYPTVLGTGQALRCAGAPAAGGVLEVSSLLGQHVGRYVLPAGGQGQLRLHGLPTSCYLAGLAGRGGPAQRIFVQP